MIQNLQSYSASIVVSNPANPPIYNNGQQSAGMIRYNTSMHRTEVYDGTSWQMLGMDGGIGLSPDAEMAISWAKEKMQEEKLLKAKMEKYPALKDAYEQFKIIEALVNEDDKLAEATASV
jgi:hypothetical protein